MNLQFKLYLNNNEMNDRERCSLLFPTCPDIRCSALLFTEVLLCSGCFCCLNFQVIALTSISSDALRIEILVISFSLKFIVL